MFENRRIQIRVQGIPCNHFISLCSSGFHLYSDQISTTDIPLTQTHLRLFTFTKSATTENRSGVPQIMGMTLYQLGHASMTKLKSTHFLKSLSPHCAILVETLPIWFQPVSSSVLLPPKRSRCLAHCLYSCRTRPPMVSTIISSLSSSGSPFIALQAFHPDLVITSYLFVRAVSTYLPTRFPRRTFL